MQNVVVDCSTGETKVVPLSSKEVADRDALAAALSAERAQRAAEEQARGAARARLGDLRAKGWASLSAAEKTEVAQRVLEAMG